MSVSSKKDASFGFSKLSNHVLRRNSIVTVDLLEEIRSKLCSLEPDIVVRRWLLTMPQSGKSSFSAGGRHWERECNISNIVQFWLQTRVAELYMQLKFFVFQLLSLQTCNYVNFNCRSTVSGSRLCSLQKSFSASVICPCCSAVRAPSAGLSKRLLICYSTRSRIS